MGTNWTDAQKSAFESRDGTVLVSAAAGSGKTKVLVERVIQRVIEKDSKIEKILVVTFTKAAANEMLERISKRLNELISADPGNMHLKRQRTFLPNATIGTMDSFCSHLLRENFQNIDISPDYKMMNDSEHDLLKDETVNEILSELYADNRPEAKLLLDLFSDNKKDENLKESILKVYNFSMSSPNPEKWIEEKLEYYFSSLSIKENIWGKYCLERVKSILEYMLVKIDRILYDAGEDSDVGKNAHKMLKNVKKDIEAALDLIKNNGEWDDIKHLVDGLKLGQSNRFSDDDKDAFYSEIIGRTKELNEDFTKVKGLLICFEDDYLDDLDYLRPIVSVFKESIIKFSNLLLEKKKKKNAYYFSDILHFALDLLVFENEDGHVHKTPLAEELSEKFDEILIDEFQDTNEAQDYLFNSISRNSENIFMVGDVKQSIYRFRQAEPKIFISYKDKFPEYEKDKYPGTINLDKNFRSRKGIIDGINYFFNLMMTRKMGDVDYKNGEQLVFGANYIPNDNLDVNVHVVEAPHHSKSNNQREALYIGNLIQEIINNKTLIRKEDENGNFIYKEATYKDICILMRGVKDKACIYARELELMGIPTYYKKEAGFFENAEIMTLVSLLTVIDNPVQDIPLIATMLSPMFAFTEDDLARLRCGDKYGSFYTILKNHYDTDEKVKYFIDTISHLRMLSVTLSISELIRRIFEITSYDSVVYAMKNGEKRQLNLQLLISYSDEFEKNGGHGLSGFIRYIEKLRKNGCDLDDANIISESANVVRITTIHSSKGLEYPIVILANSNADINHKEDETAIDKEMGVALQRYDAKDNKRFYTQQYVAVKEKNRIEEMSESMRILYVAMTRAKEKLHIVGSLYKPESAIKSIYDRFYTSEDSMPVSFSLCNSFLKWVLLCLIQHPSLAKQIKGYGLLNCKSILTDSKISLNIVPCADTEKNDLEDTEVSKDSSEVGKKEIATIPNLEEKITYEYAYKELSNTAIKHSASSINKTVETEYIATESPAFMGKNELTPAQRGTLIHRFMEKCDILILKNNVKAELTRLVNEGTFTENEAKAIDLDKIEEFVSSALYDRIVNADGFYREKQFAMSLPLSAVNEKFKTVDSERVVVQGVIDGLVVSGNNGEIIDYKTDKVSSEDELKDRYINQMQAYKLAAKECFGLENIKVTLYSFALSKEISLKL